MGLFGSFDSVESKHNASIQAEDKEIKSYELTNKILYPHLFLEIESTLPAHKMKVLKNSLEEIPYIHDKVEENYYDVILKSAGKIFILGMIHTDNLKSILQSSLFKDLDKSLRLSPYEMVKGNMMYAFCTTKIY